LLIRTPLRVGSATVWADPETGTVRSGTLRRTRTLLAGLDPASYLVAAEREILVALVGSNQALSFSVGSGVSAAIGTRPKPSWCVAVEATLPEPLSPVSSWLEVGVLEHVRGSFCSVPQGRLPQLQGGLVRQGRQMAYITRIQVIDDDDD
jgi:hypothetical protein